MVDKDKLAFQLLAASNYIDKLGGDSRNYRAALASKQEVQPDSYESIWNALQRIDTVAAMLPTYTVDHEGGIEAFTQNIVDAIQRLASKQEAQGGQVPDRWVNVESAMADPLFQRARALMGTENWFQDNALRNVVNFVLESLRAENAKLREDIGAMVREDVDCALAAATPATPAQAECAGDLGECTYNGACLYRCGRLDPPQGKKGGA